MPDRPFELTTPLGADVLLLYRMSVREELSRLPEFQLECLSSRGDIDLDRILGKQVSVKMQLAGDKPRHFTGYVTRFAQVGARGRYYSYQARVQPWFWFLTRTADCRIFQDKTVPEIVKEVFADHGVADFKDELTGKYRKWEYCVQYRETDFNFVSRLMEEEGIYYFFKYGEKTNTLVLADSYGAHTPFKGYESLPYIPPDRSGRPEQEYVSDWHFEREVQPGKYALDAFDFKKPSTDLIVRSAVKRKHDQAEHEVFDYPGEYLTTGEGDQYVRARIEELQTQFERAHGETNARGLACGHLFKLTGFGRADQNREYLVTAASHDIQAPGHESEGGEGASYRCDFSAIHSKQEFRPRRSTPKPIVQGPQTAIVVGPSGDEIYVDEYGRVKVQFHWDRYGKQDQNSSCWIRVAEPWAGKTWGMIANPRIGQEVIVEFLEGDPDQPIITGRVYNAEQMPPYELPGNKTQTGIKSRSSKGGGPANFNEIRFEDLKGSEQVFIHAEKNQDIEVENDETHWVGHDRTKTIDHDETTHVKHDRTETVDNNETITIHGNRTETVDKNETITIHQNRTETVDQDEKITIHGARTEKVDKDETITIDGQRTETVAKDETITINGARTETVAKDETITISGGRTENVSKDESITIGGGRTENVSKTESVTVGDGRTVSVGKDDSLTVAKNLTINAGDSVTITTGSASISMKKDGTIVIKGKDITIEGSGKINVKASSDVVIKGSKVGIN